MHDPLGAFHATHRMRNNKADVLQGFLVALCPSLHWRVRVNELCIVSADLSFCHVAGHLMWARPSPRGKRGHAPRSAQAHHAATMPCPVQFPQRCACLSLPVPRKAYAACAALLVLSTASDCGTTTDSHSVHAAALQENPCAANPPTSRSGSTCHPSWDQEDWLSKTRSVR